MDQRQSPRQLAFSDHRRSGRRCHPRPCVDAAIGRAKKKGFGSLKVTATIGASTFSTSVFPSKELGWLLPVKASVRKAEGIAEGDVIEVVLEL